MSSFKGRQLSLDFIKGKVASIHPSLPLAHQVRNWSHRIDLSISIRQKSHIISSFMNTHTKNTILSEIYIFIVKHSLVALWIDLDAATVDSFRKNSSHDDVCCWHFTLKRLSICYFVADWFEVVFEKNIVLFVFVIVNGIHVVGWVGSRKNMNETKRGLEWFVNNVSNVIFYLLGSLNSDYIRNAIWKAIVTLVSDSISTVCHFHLQTHVSTNTSNILVVTHILVHLQDGSGIWLEAHIHEHTIFGS